MKQKLHRSRREIGKRRLRFEEQLVEEHIGYARSIASQFYQRRRWTGIAQEELESAAFLGLAEAARRYEPTRNESFRTFSYLRMHGAMYDLLRASGERKRNHYKALFSGSDPIVSPNAELSGSAEREESNFQGACAHTESSVRYTFVSARELASFINTHDTLGFSLVVNPSGTRVFLRDEGSPNPEAQLLAAATQLSLHHAISTLPRRERIVIEMRYFQGKNYRQIQRRLPKMSKSRITQLHHRAIRLLRRQFLHAGYESGDLCPV